MFEKECVPFAPALIESMRSLGYSFPAAIADLIDNSISAQAKEINIITQPSLNPELIIVDNGWGMSDSELEEAMRYGSRNPLELRSVDDLGRFGLGMKSASLSQCRKLIVISKKEGQISGYSWDLDYVIDKGAWVLKGFDHDELMEFPFIERLLEQESGTYILLQEFDRIQARTKNIEETFGKLLDDMISHLELVFHRYLCDGVTISVNNEAIIARDPFLMSNTSTQIKRESSIYINDEKIKLKPYILPHLSKLSQSDIDKLGGKERLKNDQGFYVYRNKRLIIWGTWFRLERKDELNKFARVMVDIPNSLDYMWGIDIKKSEATLPDIIKKNMYSAVYESVLSSQAVNTYRTRKVNKNTNIEYVWNRLETRDGFEYKINRNIPQVKLLEEKMDAKELSMLNNLITILEDAFPISTMYVDMAKGKIDGVEKQELEKVWDELEEQLEYVKDSGLDYKMYCKMFLSVEPYCNYESIRNRLEGELKSYV